MMQEDKIMMKDGKVLRIRNDEEMPLEEEITMSDGTKVMPNGQMLMADGTTRMMQEGESLTVDRSTKDPEDLTDQQFKEAMEDEELRDDIK
jgi:hypothetical protein